MGQQQLLLIILGVIIVGVSIQVGVSMFSSQSVKSNHDALFSDLVNLGADCYQFKIRPAMMGGGNGSYAGYHISATSPWGVENPNATYEIIEQTSTSLILKAFSKQVNGAIVQITFDGNGRSAVGPVSSGFPE